MSITIIILCHIRSGCGGSSHNSSWILRIWSRERCSFIGALALNRFLAFWRLFLNLAVGADFTRICRRHEILDLRLIIFRIRFFIELLGPWRNSIFLLLSLSVNFKLSGFYSFINIVILMLTSLLGTLNSLFSFNRLRLCLLNHIIHSILIKTII